MKTTDKVSPMPSVENAKHTDSKQEHGGKEWSNPIEFLMTCIG